MEGALLQILIYLLIVGVVLFAINRLAPLIGIPPAFITVIQVVLGVFLLIYILRLLVSFAGIAVG